MAQMITQTLGAMYVGAMITMSLYGITTLQAYFYFVHYREDHWHIKSMVSFAWFLDTVHVVFVGHAMFHYLVSGWGNAEDFIEGIWSLYASMLVNLVMAIFVQGFFTNRIYGLCSPRWRAWIVYTLVFIVFAHFCFGIETVTEFFLKKRLDKLKEVTWIAALPFGIFAVLSDFAIAIALCVLLAGNKTEYQDTNSVINYLIVFAINRCLLTSFVAVAEVAVFAANPNSFYTLAIDFVIGKLYANSFLAALNSRRSIASRGMARRSAAGEKVSTALRIRAPGAGTSASGSSGSGSAGAGSGFAGAFGGARGEGVPLEMAAAPDDRTEDEEEEEDDDERGSGKVDTASTREAARRVKRRWDPLVTV